MNIFKLPSGNFKLPSEKRFDPLFLSAFCMELSLALKTELPLADGLSLLAESEGDKKSAYRGYGAEMSRLAAEGYPLSEIMERLGPFPDHLCALISIAEKTGRLEEALRSASVYYDRRRRLEINLRAAVIYPLLLTLLLLCVTLALIIRVVPVFNEISYQLGADPPAVSLLLAGAGKLIADNPLPAALIFIASAAVSAAIIYFALKNGAIAAAASAARFSAAFEMIIRSGLDVGDSAEMLYKLSGGSADTKRLGVLASALKAGRSFPEAVAESGIYAPFYCRMISVGYRTGSLDVMMGEVARRGEEELEDRLESAAARLEPAAVILLAFLVGLVMVSVMLPLIKILALTGG